METETEFIIPIDDMGNGEESLVISIMKDIIKFEVLDDEDNLLYSDSQSYETLCNSIEARDLYLQAAVLRHPASLQLIDGGGNKVEGK
jgi:hypothetical protein